MTLSVRSFRVIWIRISDSRSFGLWYIKGTNESVTRVDSSGSFDLMIQSDIGSLKEIKDDLICRKKQTFDDEVLLFEVSAAT